MEIPAIALAILGAVAGPAASVKVASLQAGRTLADLEKRLAYLEKNEPETVAEMRDAIDSLAKDMATVRGAVERLTTAHEKLVAAARKHPSAQSVVSFGSASRRRLLPPNWRRCTRSSTPCDRRSAMRADESIDTDRPSTLPGFSEREIVERGLEHVLDALTGILEEEIDYIRRSKSDPPPSGDRETLPSMY
jgi:hypothetical protein